MITKVVFILVLMISILFLYGSPTSIDMEGMKRKMDIRSVSTSVKAMMLAEQNYLQMTRKDLPIATWRQSLSGTGNKVPHIPGVTITYAETSGVGRYFCLTSDVGVHRRIVDLFSEVRKRIVDNDGYVGFINENCGATTAAANPAALSSISFTIYTGS